MYYLLNTDFPDPETADADGLLAIGGDLEPETLLAAYQKGIFPWYSDDEPILWWCPDPRLVLFPSDVVVSKSMKQVLKKGLFKFSIDEAFDQVIANCREIRMKDTGTWITHEIMEAYQHLFDLGHAHSTEVWVGDELVGGLYGVQIGKVFFGESMFSLQSNASKAALIYWCLHCVQNEIELIDCQQSTAHLQSMGAKEISRSVFLTLLEELAV